jgi:hypothetical protein
MTRFKPGLLVLTALLTIACSDNEAPPAEDHTPTSYSIQVNDVPVAAPYTLVSGQTVHVRIKFFNAAQEDLDDVADSHFGALSFDPASLATVVRDPDHNYEFEVTGGSPGTGTLQASYGHDAAADEHTLAAAAVTVTPEGGAASSQ